MKIPKYVQDMMTRARISNDDYNLSSADPGYTLRISKATPYTQTQTFIKELDQLIRWAKKNYAFAKVLAVPARTKHCNQFAAVVITDPVMFELEKHTALKH